MSTVLTNDEAKEYLAAHLQRLLEEKGVSQAALARAIDVTPMTISHYLAATVMAGSGPLARMAEFFGVSTDYLVSKPRYKKSQKSA
jgi:transcriptional regulator with XRE-family HTH domain